MNNKTLLILPFCLITVSLTAAQTLPLTGEMKKLDFLVGEWKGEGWKLRQDGSRENSFTQKTKVQIKNASLLHIKSARTYKPVISSGQGKDIDFPPGTPLYEASSLKASIYYDDKIKLYRWGGETIHPNKNPLEVKLVCNKSLQYGIPFSVPFEPTEQSRRTTILVTEAGEWHEMDEIWSLGRWLLVEESILKKLNDRRVDGARC